MQHQRARSGMVASKALFWHVYLALLLGVLAVPVHAQSTAKCEARHPAPEMLASMYDLAALVADTLDTMPDVNAVIAARSGQDLSRYGLRHSHLAFLLRDQPGHWQVIHLLNQCASGSSSLYREGLVGFIDKAALNSAGIRIGIPTAPLQAAIAQLLAKPAREARALHQPRYSAVAYPWRTHYQNSNQWILEVAAAAMAHDQGIVLADRNASTAWLREHGYTPSRLHIGIGKRLGARFFAKNVAVTDHPGGERISGNYSVVTVESVFDFLHHRGALEREITVTLAQATASGVSVPHPLEN